MLKLKEYRESCTAILRYADGHIEEIKEFPGVPHYINSLSGKGFIRFELVWLSGDSAVYRQTFKSTQE